jgi:hypothetical protein
LIKIALVEDRTLVESRTMVEEVVGSAVYRGTDGRFETKQRMRLNQPSEKLV